MTVATEIGAKAADRSDSPSDPVLQELLDRDHQNLVKLIESIARQEVDQLRTELCEALETSLRGRSPNLRSETER
jgi:hypothetical protein